MKPPRPASRATTVVVCADAVAVADAAASACRNRSSPARQRKRLREAPPRNERPERTERPERNDRPERNERPDSDLNLRIEVDDSNALPGQNGPSVPNTARRRDTSPSFCRESRSPNIPVWPSAPACTSQRAVCGCRSKSSRLSPLRKFLPTMNLSLRQPLLRRCGCA